RGPPVRGSGRAPVAASRRGTSTRRGRAAWGRYSEGRRSRQGRAVRVLLDAVTRGALAQHLQEDRLAGTVLDDGQVLDQVQDALQKLAAPLARGQGLGEWLSMIGRRPLEKEELRPGIGR